MLAAEEGLVNLKYLNEAGFCLRSSANQIYAPVVQKCMEQTPIHHDF